MRDAAMNCPDDIPFFDSEKSTGDEAYHQQTFFNQLRKHHPAIASIAIHVENEGKKTMAQSQHSRLMGQVKGASDIIIPARVPLVMELKIWSGRLSKEQVAYLRNVSAHGAYGCVAVGFHGAWAAFNFWLDNFQ